MTDSETQGWQGIFDGQKVPFDLRAILLAAIACGLFTLGLVICGYFATIHGTPETMPDNTQREVMVSMGTHEVCQRFFTGLGRMFVGLQFYGEHPEIKLLSWPWYFLILIYLFTLWIFFGAMISRIIVVKIAKDDVISIATAFQFAHKNKMAYFLTPLVLFGIIGFLCLCNWLAGVVGSIPWIGPILYVGLYFLVLLSTIFIFLVSIGAVFGFNLITSAISAEGSDGLEAVISVYNYIYSRPWHFIFYYFLTFLSMIVLCYVSHFFVDFSLSSAGIRTDTIKIQKVAGEGGKIVKTVLLPFNFKYETDPNTGTLRWVRETAQEVYYLPSDSERQLPEGSHFYEQGLEVIGEYVYGVPFEQPTVNQNEGTRDFGQLTTTTQPFPLSEIRTIPLKIAAVVLYGITVLIRYFFYGWILAYFFSASTLIYFLLRKEIDGTEYEEIYEDEVSEEATMAPLPQPEKKETPKIASEPVQTNVVVNIPEHLRKGGKKESETPTTDSKTVEESSKKEETTSNDSTKSESDDTSKKESQEKASSSHDHGHHDHHHEHHDHHHDQDHGQSSAQEKKSEETPSANKDDDLLDKDDDDAPPGEEEDYQGPKIYV